MVVDNLRSKLSTTTIQNRIKVRIFKRNKAMIDHDNRPWGRWEEYLFEPSYRVKRIVVFPGKRLSLQRHHLRSEVWVIVEGEGILTLGSVTREVKTGDIVTIAKEEIHRVENNSSAPLVLIETQIGICPEDDVERLEDDYGRA